MEHARFDQIFFNRTAASEVEGEPAETPFSADEEFATQSTVTANFVDIAYVPKPDSEKEEQQEEEFENETNEIANSLDEDHLRG